MTAGSAGEVAFEHAELGHGVFTAKLLENLNAQAAIDGNVVLASELFSALKVPVTNLTGGKQTPQFGNHAETEGDFVFVSFNPEAARRAPAYSGQPPAVNPVGGLATGKVTPKSLLSEAKTIAFDLGDREYDQATTMLKVAVGLAANGEVEEAKKLAISYKWLQWGQYSFEALMDIAGNQAAAGDKSGAAATLALVKQEIEAMWRARSGATQETTGWMITDPSGKAHAIVGLLVRLAKSQLLVKDSTGAKQSIASAKHMIAAIPKDKETANSVRDTGYDEMLAAVAGVEQLAGNGGEALRTLGMMALPRHTSLGIAAIAVSIAEGGDSQSAIRLATSIADSWERSEALSDITVALCKAGKIGDAKAAANQIVGSIAMKARALAQIVAYQLSDGDVEGAAKTLSDAKGSIENVSTKDANGKQAKRLAEMELMPVGVQMQARQGNLTAAIQTASSHTGRNKSEALAAIAVALAQAGDASGAKRTADSILDPAHRSRALVDVAMLLLPKSVK